MKIWVWEYDKIVITLAIWVCFLQLFDLSTPKASNRDPTAQDYFMHMKNIFLGKLQNFHNSGDIGPFVKFEVSIETSVQGHSGF